MKKRHQFFLICLIAIILLKPVSALGVSPGKIEFNFQPNMEEKILYQVFEDDSSKEMSISIDGDLADYAKLSTDTLVGGGVFYVTLKLPEEIEKPGKNVLYVRVQEKVDDELVEGSVGTSVSIGAAIVVHVPYPGKYLELSLSSNNANVGEPIDFILDVKSKGSEIISIIPRIEITSEDELIDTLYFNSREIASQEELKLKKTLDTADYNPGKYNAVAKIDYDDQTAQAEHEFKIGELIIHVLDYTRKIFIGGLDAFEIKIESGWNNNIDGVYGEVSISNGINELTSFKTETTSLVPWEEKTIKGYFDSGNFSAGIYNTNITLIYYGKDQGRSTSEIVEVEFAKKLNVTMIAIILGIIVLAIILFFIRKKYFKENGKKKK